jgi:hypothetical protein
LGVRSERIEKGICEGKDGGNSRSG